MTQEEGLFHWFFQPLHDPKTGTEIWKWWEKRRVLYNMIVIATSLFSFLAFEYFADASGKLAPGEDAEEPMGLFLAMFIGPVLWNLAYCLGPLIDIATFRTKAAKHCGPLLLKFGTVFSILVLCLPSGAWFVIWLGVVAKRCWNFYY